MVLFESDEFEEETVDYEREVKCFNIKCTDHVTNHQSQFSTLMSSTFNGWSAYDIVGSLNRKEVRAALLDFNIERGCFRTWDTIEDMILASSDEVKSVVYESALAKKKVEEQHRTEILKRKREEEFTARSVRRRLGVYFFFFMELLCN